MSHLSKDTLQFNLPEKFRTTDEIKEEVVSERMVITRKQKQGIWVLNSYKIRIVSEV